MFGFIDKDLFQDMMNTFYESVSEKVVCDILENVEAGSDSMDFFKMLIKNGCPASVILKTFTEFSTKHKKVTDETAKGNT